MVKLVFYLCSFFSKAGRQGNQDVGFLGFGFEVAWLVCFVTFFLFLFLGRAVHGNIIASFVWHERTTNEGTDETNDERNVLFLG